MTLWTRLVPAAGAAAVTAIGATLRLRASGVDTLRPLWRAKRPVIYAIWHGRILLAPWVNARLRRREGARSVCVLASRSRDGELVAAFARRFGLDVVRGSSSRGGAAALRALVRALRAGHDVAVVPDGPRGPAGRLQAGIITLAASTGAPIVPMALAARPARRLGSWDRFMVPAPFARCVVVFGPALIVRREADREGQRSRVERALHDVTESADRLVRA
jgi:lysophospholipid acyltransferase (LPLAT)-like uncharacterized protein